MESAPELVWGEGDQWRANIRLPAGAHRPVPGQLSWRVCNCANAATAAAAAARFAASYSIRPAALLLLLWRCA